MNNHFQSLLILLISLIGFASCKSYKQHIMFKVDEDEDLSFLSAEIEVVERQYKIQPNDLLELRVYTNKGERLIDPNFELRSQGTQTQREQDLPQFFVLEDGSVKFPMIDTVYLEGMTLREAEIFLEKKYNEYYKEAFVRLKYLNKRVVVLGSPGGQLVPLQNENMSVIEVIAMAGGIDESGKAHNLRLIRGDLHNPTVFMIDLSTIKGMRTSMMEALPGDIIYIEPTRKIVSEAARDFMTVFAIFVNAITLVALIVTISNQ